MFKNLRKVILACCLAAVLASGIGALASAAHAATNYTLTVSRTGSGNGNVTSSPTGIDCGSTCSAAFEAETYVMLTATPGTGYSFAGWSGGACAGTETSCWVWMAEATTVAAEFVPTRVLTVSPTGSGTGRVNSYPGGIECPSICSEPVAQGTHVEIYAYAEAGSVFTGWSGGGCSGVEYLCSVTVDADTTVKPRFVPARTLSITVNEYGKGYVSAPSPGYACSYVCPEEFAEGTEVTLTPTAYAGYRFTGWSGACSGTGACVVTLGANAAVTANFGPIPDHTLKVSEAGPGKGVVFSTFVGIECGTDCTESYEEGTSVTLSAYPYTGDAFAGWSGGGCSGTGTCTVTMAADTEVTATFSAPHTLTVYPNGSGSGRVDSSPAGIGCSGYCSASFEDGTQVTLTATPASGSSFGGWSGGGCGGTGTCTVTLKSSVEIHPTFNVVQPPQQPYVRKTVEKVTRTSKKAGSKAGAAGGEEPLRAAVDGKIVIHGPTYEAHLRVKRTSPSTIEIHGHYADQAGCRLVNGHNTLSCPIGGIKELEFIMGPSDDKVEIESPMPFPVTAHMGAGSDKFIGNDEDDTCYSEGTKRNRCIGNGGNDVCITGNLNSDCVGGPGNDLCHEGAGSDGCFGGPGNDICIMGAGNDGCHGGPGNDRLYGGPGLDQLYGGSGYDYCDGGPGVGRSHECEAGPGG